jgi:serine phosphatase RsbU (regulator of sigma subunit)
MLDRAITVTDADRALLLEADESGSLRPRLARRTGSLKLPPETFTPSRTAVNTALEQQSGVITEDLDHADGALQNAISIVNQRLRAVVAIPLYAKAHSRSDSSGSDVQEHRFLGVMYLDSTRRAAFSKLDRQILDAIAIESASIIENARLVRLEQERRRVEQELNIARNIQQALLPRGFREFPHVSITGVNMPCHEVGGDYFDILPVSADRISFLIADVSGKGLGAALLTTMLQGAFSGISTGSDPERIFQRINSFLCERSDVGRHATMFLGTLDSDGSLEYLNAGHPSPMLVRRGEVHDLYTRGSLPLGLMPECQYPVSRVKLEPDDRLILFSDGITEAENSCGEFFGESRLRSLLAGQHDTPLDVLQRDIAKTIERFSNGASQADDITLLIVRYKSRNN